MTKRLDYSHVPATPGWATSAGPTHERDFLKNKHRTVRDAARQLLRGDGRECGFASDAYLAREVAKKLGHVRTVGTPIAYLTRCYDAKLLGNK